MNVKITPQSINIGMDGQTAEVNTGTPIVKEYIDRPAYEGPYSVTPTESVQTLQTKNFRMTDNIVVNPIPSNYGLITWDGSIITVS